MDPLLEKQSESEKEEGYTLPLRPIWLFSEQTMLVEDGFPLLTEDLPPMEDDPLHFRPPLPFHPEFETLPLPPFHWRSFCANSNPHAVQWMLQHPTCISGWGLSRNANDQAVTWLFDHPSLQHWDEMGRNANDRVVQWMLSRPNRLTWWGLVNLYSNPHPDIVAFLLSAQYNRMMFSSNANDRALDIVLNSSPPEINWVDLSKNANDRAVDLLLQHPEYIDGKGMSVNTNPRALHWLTQHPQHITEDIWSNPMLFAFEHSYLLK